MKTLVTECKWAGKFLNFFHYHLDNGKIYEVCSRKKIPDPNNCDAVDIIAFNKSKEKVCVVSEYRVPVGKRIIAFPAGLRESDEHILDTAKRELFEETGLTITHVIKQLPPAFQSPGMSDENVATIICVAEGEPTNSNATSDEDICPMWIDRLEAYDMIKQNKPMSVRVQIFLSMWLRLF